MSIKKSLVIIDLGISNIKSVYNAFQFLGYEALVSRDPKNISRCEYIVIPGVGAFPEAMRVVLSTNIKESILEAVLNKNSQVLGICLGFQMLCLSSTENGFHRGLGLIPCQVKKLNKKSAPGKKTPHIGFNEVKFTEENTLYNGISSPGFFYFVHSYHIIPGSYNQRFCFTDLGVPLAASYHYENITGTQFHPEKSQGNGLRFLANWIGYKK